MRDFCSCQHLSRNRAISVIKLIPSNFSLRDEKFRSGLKKFLLDNRCRYLVLDNLLSLTDNNHDGCSHHVLSWIASLTYVGICVILLHHTDTEDSSKPRGNQDYVSKARVTINLIHKEELATLKNIPDDIRKLATDPTLTVGINYINHKAAPELAGNTFWISLPMGENRWIFKCAINASKELMDSPWNEDIEQQNPTVPSQNPQATNANDSQDVPPDSELIAHDEVQTPTKLSPDERLALDAFKEFDGTARRNQIQEKRDWGEDKTNKILGQLASRNLIARRGSGKSTYYELT